MNINSCYLFQGLSQSQIERIAAFTREQQIQKGQCLGIGALVEPYRYSLSARCLNDSILLVIEQAKLHNLKRNDSELRCIIFTNLAQKLLDRLKETRQEVKIHFMNLVRSVIF
jgi:hypothetical protein